MFRPPSFTATAKAQKPLGWRLLMIAGAVVLLWLALRVMPRAGVDEAPPTTETLASQPDVLEAPEVSARPLQSQPLQPQPTVFSPGTLAALALLAGGVGLAWYLRRRRPAGGNAPAIEPLGHLNLAPQQQLRLIRCGGEVLLLGVTTGQITLLKSYDEHEFTKALPEAAIDEKGVAPEDGSSFVQLLQQQLQGRLNVQATEVPC